MWSPDRRDLLQRAAVLVGAALSPGLGFEAFAATAGKAKITLDAARFALLSAIADTIIPKTATPGALDAGVPKQVDALLRTWASPARRAELVAALDAIDRAAEIRHQRHFAALTAAERHNLLTPYDAAALTPVIAGGAGVGFMQSPATADAGYAKLKELVVVLFYCSEAALTHDLAYEHSPGEWQSSIPVTAATRPWGGASLF